MKPPKRGAQTVLVNFTLKKVSVAGFSNPLYN